MSAVARRLPLVTGTILLLFAGNLGAARAALVAHYRLDESSGTTAVDSAGANDGTLINAANVSLHEFGEIGSAYGLAGGGGVNLGTSSTVQLNDDFTITFWFNANTLDQFDRLVESMNGTVATSRGLRIDLGAAPGDSVRVLLRDGSGSSDAIQHAANLDVGQWNFVALRYDKDGQIQLTVIPQTGPLSGNVVAGSTQSQGANLSGGVLYQAGVPTVLGVENSSGPAGNALNGRLDDVAFYDTVLSDDEVKFVGRFGAQTTFPVLAWDGADPGASPSTAWASNLDAAGAISWNASSPAHVTGIDTQTRLTEAYRFDGTGMAVASSLLPNRSANLTVELWVKPDDLAGQELLFEAGGDGNGMSLRLDGDQLHFRFDQDSVLPGTQNLDLSTTLDSALLDDFIQIVGTVDLAGGASTDAIALFVNGQPAGSLLAGVNIDSWAGGNADSLGSSNGTGSDIGGTDSNDLDPFGTFEGLIGAVRLYNDVLSLAQIQANYQAMLAVPEPTGLAPALVGCVFGFFFLRRRRRSG